MVFVVVFVWSMYRTSGWAYVPSIFTRMPGESYRQRLRSLLLCLFDVFRALVNSVVCRFNLCPGYAKRKKRKEKNRVGGGGGFHYTVLGLKVEGHTVKHKLEVLHSLGHQVPRARLGATADCTVSSDPSGWPRLGGLFTTKDKRQPCSTTDLYYGRLRG